jgi:GNAT superfamily N-acetyltransferase
VSSDDVLVCASVGDVPDSVNTIIEVIDQAATGEQGARVAEQVMRALPEWFGLEESLLEYVQAATRLPTLIASEGSLSIGFLTMKQQTPQSVEIVAMGVLPEWHRRGIGRSLVEAAIELVAARGARLLQVKTLGPSHPSKSYARTRAFYEVLGFIPVEETTAFWGSANPCLIMVKPLR